MVQDAGSVRTSKIKFNIYLSILFKGIGIGLSFWLVPLTLRLMGQEIYGVWVVMLSIITWIALFDVGIGNGLRNKLSENITEGDYQKARSNVTTAYLIISSIGALLMLISFLLFPYLNWQEIFNIRSMPNEKLELVMLIFVCTLISSFILGLINPILNAFQLSAFTNAASILTSLLFVTFLFFFQNILINNLVALTCFYGVALIISYVIVTGVFFYKNPTLFPKIKYFQRNLSKPLLTLGSSFFIIQVAVLLIFTVDNFLILQLLGPEAVSTYNITFKLFSIFTIGYSVLMTPLWSAFTEAYIRKDLQWISMVIRLLNLSLIPLLLCLGVFMFFNQDIMNLWLPGNRELKSDNALNLALGAFVLISVWNNIYSFFLNGVSETKLQKRTAVFGAIINLPTAYLLVSILGFGLSGIVLAMCLSLIPFSIFGPREYYRIIKRLKESL